MPFPLESLLSTACSTAAAANDRWQLESKVSKVVSKAIEIDKEWSVKDRVAYFASGLDTRVLGGRATSVATSAIEKSRPVAAEIWTQVQSEYQTAKQTRLSGQALPEAEDASFREEHEEAPQAEEDNPPPVNATPPPSPMARPRTSRTPRTPRTSYDSGLRRMASIPSPLRLSSVSVEPEMRIYADTTSWDWPLSRADKQKRLAAVDAVCIEQTEEQLAEAEERLEKSNMRYLSAAAEARELRRQLKSVTDGGRTRRARHSLCNCYELHPVFEVEEAERPSIGSVRNMVAHFENN